MGMKATTPIHTTGPERPIAENLMALTTYKLEAWFEAGGLTVKVVSNCNDPSCPDCVTVLPVREAA